MTVNKRSKNSRHRGSWTHGYGEKKKHRGAGSRGGRGRAGTGKRGDQKKPNVASNKLYFGKHGFKRPVVVKVTAINVATVETTIDTLIAKKCATSEKGAYTVDLTKAGYTKLLGTGKVTSPLIITVGSASAKAVEKVEKLGGKVILPGAE